MARKISKYVNYTVEELEHYKDIDACVKKMSANLHLNVVPFALNNFKESLIKILSSKKIGSYDETMEGIILGLQNIKLISTSGGIRFDDPKIHLDIVSDCYIFKPTIGAIVRGTVRHISSSQIGVIIYRVFSASIRLVNKSNTKLEVNSEIEFRIKQFDLQNAYPYIEGELLKSTHAHNLRRPKLEIKEDPEDLKNVIQLITEIKNDELDESESKCESPPKPKKRKKGVTIKTEE